MTSVNYSKQNISFCLELDRIKLLLEKLGNPDKKFFIIHVAGTNGKGSVCSFIKTGLVSMGIKCGCFTSPELFCVEDSISVNGREIELKRLKYILSRLKPHCDAIEKELGKAPSSFELLFAAALVHFKKEKCTHVILECGMGGVGDATNAVGHSDICVFTDIGIDHAEYLGNTLEEIATNKSGIIKDNSMIVSANQHPEAEAVLVKRCKETHSQLGFVKSFGISRMDGFNTIVNAGFGEVRLSLAGCHQTKNAAVAAAVLKVVGASEKTIAQSLTQTVHKARFEEIEPGVYFDGAHNPDGIRALVNSINASGYNGKINFVMGFMADKDISSCLDEFKNLKIKEFEFFTTKVHSNPRSETAENLKDIINKKGFEATTCDDVRGAVECAKEADGIVFVIGSLYMYKELIGEGRQ